MKSTRGERQTPGRRRRGPSEEEVVLAGIGALDEGEDRFESLKNRGRRVVRKGVWGRSSERARRPKPQAAGGELPDMGEMVRRVRAIVRGGTIEDATAAAPAAPDVGPTEMSELIEVLTPLTVPTAAMVLQARRNSAARLALAQEFGLLSGEEVAEVRGSSAANRSALASRWKQEGRILAVQHHGHDRFPGFQFDTEGRPLPAVSEVVALLGQGWETALWFVASNPYLEDERPVDRLPSDAAAVVAAAQREADAPEF